MRPRPSQPPGAAARASSPGTAAAPARTSSTDDHAADDIEHGDDEHVAGLTRAFFSRPPAEPGVDPWDDASVPPPPMTAGARRAMYATVAIFTGFALLMLGYLAYSRWIMPVPVELGGGAELPELAPAPPPEAARPAPAPMERPRAAVVPAIATAQQPQAQGPVEPLAAAAEQAPAIATAQQPQAQGPVELLAAAAEQAPDDARQEAPANAPAAPEQQDARVLSALQQAHALYERGQNRQALAAYQAVLDLDPNAAVALSRVAHLHLQAGKDALARTYASRAVAIDATSSEGWIVLGAAREALRDRSGAREAYRKCAELGQGDYVTECRRLAR